MTLDLLTLATVRIVLSFHPIFYVIFNIIDILIAIRLSIILFWLRDQNKRSGLSNGARAILGSIATSEYHPHSFWFSAIMG